MSRMNKTLIANVATWQAASETARAAEDKLALAFADYFANRRLNVPASLAADVGQARCVANERLAAVLAQMATD